MHCWSEVMSKCVHWGTFDKNRHAVLTLSCVTFRAVMHVNIVYFFLTGKTRLSLSHRAVSTHTINLHANLWMLWVQSDSLGELNWISLQEEDKGGWTSHKNVLHLSHEEITPRMQHDRCMHFSTVRSVTQQEILLFGEQWGFNCWKLKGSRVLIWVRRMV